MGMKMITKELMGVIPMYGTTSKLKPEDVKVQVKYFCPWNQWTWYATEGYAVMPDGTELPLSKVEDLNEVADVIFFGYVRGDFDELGSFSLNELKSVKGPMAMFIERDLHFGNYTLADVMEKRR